MNDAYPSSAPPCIEVTRLTRRFGAKTALDEVSLTIPTGGVLGLIGANGAGKTMLIKHLLGMLRAEQGSVRVFGQDPIANPVGVLGRIGYLSEDRDMPDWMRVRELMNYTQAFFPNWDQRYAEELREAFDLNPNDRIKTLSRGQRARAGLLAALALVAAAHALRCDAISDQPDRHAARGRQAAVSYAARGASPEGVALRLALDEQAGSRCTAAVKFHERRSRCCSILGQRRHNLSRCYHGVALKTSRFAQHCENGSRILRYELRVSRKS